jgi:hypothetical protein
MYPEQKIKQTIITNWLNNGNVPDDEDITISALNEETVNDIYDELIGDMRDDLEEFREGEVETDIPCDWSRQYETKSVAAKMADGSWVGWTYWYGGGKHGEPESIDWMDRAYDLEVSEKEMLTIVRTFTKVK